MLAALGEENVGASETMNDVLAQVATNTETNRNAGNAILYECVKAIMTIQSESGLRILAINILGRFLLNRDNNIRYVALNSLSNVVTEDVIAVQRHRATILDCLKDPDISIRQRALEITYQLVDVNNVVELVREMLNYLVVAPAEHRGLLCSRVSIVVEKFSPSPRWLVETLITMLSIAGNYCDSRVASAAISHLTMSEALQGYATHKLFRLLRDELPRVQIALMHLAIWCIGEFGDRLLERSAIPDTDSDNAYDPIPLPEILGLLQAVLKSHLATTLSKSYVLTTLTKCACRFQHGKIECSGMMKHYISSLSLELQQRSCEYMCLLDERWRESRHQALAKMPTMTPVVFSPQKQSVDKAETTSVSMFDKSEKTKPNDASSDLIDLVNVLGDEQDAQDPSREGVLMDNCDARSMNDADLLSDIFSGSASTHQTASIQFDEAQVLDQPIAVASQVSFKAFEKDGLMVNMLLLKDGANSIALDITCKFSNSTSIDFNNFVFQVAVPKSISMELKPASANIVPANTQDGVSQTLRVQNLTPSKPLMMRLKIQYSVAGQQVIEQAQISSFPLP